MADICRDLDVVDADIKHNMLCEVPCIFWIKTSFLFFGVDVCCAWCWPVFRIQLLHGPEPTLHASTL